MDAPRVCVRAWVLGCFYSDISTQTFWRALTASVDSCAEIKSAPFGGVTKSGRVWRMVPESDARSVGVRVTEEEELEEERKQKRRGGGGGGGDPKCCQWCRSFILRDSNWKLC